MKCAFAAGEWLHAFLLLWLAERYEESLGLGPVPHGISELQPLPPNKERKQWKTETKYHCLQIKTRKHKQGAVKLLLEASK